MSGAAGLGGLWNTIQAWLFPMLEDELGELDEKHREFIAVCEMCDPRPHMRGYLGLIVQSGLATDESRKFLFRYLFESGRLASLHDFENTELLFPGVHPQQKFSLVTLAREEQASSEP